MMKFFLPDWEDRVDPNYDFVNDTYSEDHEANCYENDLYAHEIFKDPTYHGILISLAIFRNKIKLNGDKDIFKIRNHSSVKDFLRINNSPNKLEVIGDCGAFSYIHEKNPPLPFYSVENIAKLYHSLGFDYGVSVDHMAVDYYMTKDPKGNKVKTELTVDEKKKRIKLTLDNAKKFKEIHDDEKYSFKPIGVAQGYSAMTYKNSTKKLLDMGYDYIAFGGLVSRSDEFIKELLQKIEPVMNSDTHIHLFGLMRPHLHEDFTKYGVTSIDSASYLRKSWLKSGQNYLGTNNEWYSAIRVPYSNNKKLIMAAVKMGIKEEELKKMEKEALNALIQYDQGILDVDSTIKKVMDYDDLLLRNSHKDIKEGKIEAKYRKTLVDQPWKKCQCEICKDIGIHVVIFRGANRNKRRGFHNISVVTKSMS